ncbi:bifunctional phosphoribosylaminoimidazolecarboxamide formyltransferase/IMP cyclohydrolase, partial [Candidatus Woesearchaeota archaeon]|nr:bifunctional phosphoribosylaminoimidazolecarboxamide formyltransferase/IMP cyclohydrolase [Candidatus Woesearchaeota archaeon]
SVSDKTGVADFAKELIKLDFEIISTGGTAGLLEKEGIKVTKISDYTGFPEILDGRVKTLHPKIHGGILARNTKEHLGQLSKNEIPVIDIVVVNLYPFESTVSRECTIDEAIENIDIGGPTMIRAAAKNFERIIVVVDPADYPSIINELKNDKNVSAQKRFELAGKVFEHTARYDSLINNYLNKIQKVEFPGVMNISMKIAQKLRYGENPHQKASVYTEFLGKGIANSKAISGKEMSFNNYLDASSALGLISEFSDETVCAILKHTNPCGCAAGKDCRDAFEKAKQTDPSSAFGGIVAFSRELDKETAGEVAKTFFEIVIAPGFSEDALNTLKEKKNLRIIEAPLLKKEKSLDVKRISGGYLVQENDTGEVTTNNIKVVTKREPSKEEIEDMLFAWKVIRHIKSNAIIYVKGKQTLGIGAGQMSRIDSNEIAIRKAEKVKLSLNGSVLASDAFFPFRDNVDLAAKQGVVSIIQPGGSLKDEESIKACDENNISMVFTGRRCFRH